jgi:lysine 6-dehydrogenase
MGSAPGKTNLMGRMAADELRDPAAPGRGAEEAAGVGSVDVMHVSAGGRDLDPPDGFSIPYALQTLLDELTMKPVVLRDGSPVEIKPMSDGGTVDFGQPIGEAETIYTIHSEMRTFGPSFGCREASFRLGLKAELLDTLRELTEASEDEVARKAKEALPPSASTVSVHLVEASGDGRAVRVRAVTEPMEEWGIGGGVVSTATPVSAAVRLLARGEISERGVLPPESCVDPAALFAELEPRGCRVEIQAREEAKS